MRTDTYSIKVPVSFTLSTKKFGFIDRIPVRERIAMITVRGDIVLIAFRVIFLNVAGAEALMA